MNAEKLATHKGTRIVSNTKKLCVYTYYQPYETHLLYIIMCLPVVSDYPGTYLCRILLNSFFLEYYNYDNVLIEYYIPFSSKKGKCISIKKTKLTRRFG